MRLWFSGVEPHEVPYSVPILSSNQVHMLELPPHTSGLPFPNMCRWVAVKNISLATSLLLLHTKLISIC